MLVRWSFTEWVAKLRICDEGLIGERFEKSDQIRFFAFRELKTYNERSLVRMCRTVHRINLVFLFKRMRGVSDHCRAAFEYLGGSRLSLLRCPA